MKSYECLNKYLSLNECSALNVDGSEPISGILSSTSTIYSNVDDPQLLITLRFNQNVNITQIKIESGNNKEICPNELKIFVGREDLDFDDVIDMNPTEKFDLSKNLGKLMRVNIPRFRNVNLMTLFFYNNDAEKIQINSIKLYGEGGKTNIDFGEMKKNPVT